MKIKIYFIKILLLYILVLSPCCVFASEDGKKISVDFQGIELQAALRYITDIAGVNLIVNDEVKGVVTLRLDGVPWQDALDLLLKSHGLGEQINFYLL